MQSVMMPARFLQQPRKDKPNTDDDAHRFQIECCVQKSVNIHIILTLDGHYE